MKVYQLQVGNMQNFTYVLEDEDTKEDDYLIVISLIEESIISLTFFNCS